MCARACVPCVIYQKDPICPDEIGCVDEVYFPCQNIKCFMII